MLILNSLVVSGSWDSCCQIWYGGSEENVDMTRKSNQTTSNRFVYKLFSSSRVAQTNNREKTPTLGQQGIVVGSPCFWRMTALTVVTGHCGAAFGLQWKQHNVNLNRTNWKIIQHDLVAPACTKIASLLNPSLNLSASNVYSQVKEGV